MNKKKHAGHLMYGKFFVILFTILLTVLSAVPFAAALSIDAQIPEYVSLDKISITGTISERVPDAKLQLTLNVNGKIQQTLSDINSETFTFENIVLDKTKENIIIINAIDGTQDAEKSGMVLVDLEIPRMTIGEIPAILTTPTLEIAGTASEEPLEIEATVVRNVQHLPKPPKIVALTQKEVTPQSVEIQWTPVAPDDTNFKHYVIYRNDKPHEIIGTPTESSYRDNFVASNTKYTYQLSVVSIDGILGEKSPPLTITTPAGEFTEPNDMEPIDIFEGTRGVPKKVTAQNFPLTLDFGDIDGEYTLTITARDRAGNNAAVISKKIKLDTTPLTVEIQRPQDGSVMFENRANNIDVEGTTKPYATVMLFVQRKSLNIQPSSDFAFDVSGLLPDEISQINKIGFSIGCTQGEQQKPCMEYTNKKTKADKDGKFKFEKVDLTPVLSLKYGYRENDLVNPQTPVGYQDKEAYLLAFAYDDAGGVAQDVSRVGIGSCWSQNQEWAVSVAMQDPPLLSPERIAENTEEIYLLFEFTYFGPTVQNAAQNGAMPKIRDVQITPACNFVAGDTTGRPMDRFERGCELFNGGRAVPSPDGTKAYAVIKLNRKEGMETWIDKNWTKFFEGLGKESEITFPLQIQFTYEKPYAPPQNIGQIGQAGQINPTGQNQVDLRTQRTVVNDLSRFTRDYGSQTVCNEVTYVVDNAVISPGDVLPDFLLTTVSDSLEYGVGKLEDTDKKVMEPAAKIAAGSCGLSYAARFGAQVYRHIVTAIDEAKIKSVDFERLISGGTPAGKLIGGGFLGEKDGAIDATTQAECIALATKLGTENKGLKDVTDADLRKCFTRSAKAWELESKAYLAYRFGCDRLLGHAAPSRWTEKEADENIKKQIENNIGCASDQSFEGAPLRRYTCKDVPKINKNFGKAIDDLKNNEDDCFIISEQKKDSLYVLGGKVEKSDNIYHLSHKVGDYEVKKEYALKIGDNYYLTSKPQTCAEICGSEFVSQTGIKNDEVKISKDTNNVNKITVSEKSKTAAASDCLKVSSCRNIIKNSDTNLNFQGQEFAGGTYSVDTLGFTSDCFYGSGSGNNDVAVVSDDPNSRKECCCVMGEKGKTESRYFTPGDTVDGKQIHESKSGKESLGENDYADMKFSYRYYVDGFKVGDVRKNYNPQRYIDGRDFSACFGADNLFLKGAQKDVKQSVELNPFTEHTAAFQCGYVTGIRKRLTTIKDILDKMNKCLVQIRESDYADTGSCKEVFTTQVCGLFWQMLGAFKDNCNVADTTGRTHKDSEDYSVGANIKKGFFEAVAGSQNDFKSEYPNADATSQGVFGTGSGSVARKLCVAALSSDWGTFNLETLTDLSQKTPSQSVVSALFPRREYLTTDPTNANARYEYRTGLYINPGCPITRYDVSLVCITQKELSQYPDQIDCAKVGDKEGGSGCDCINLQLDITPELAFMSGGNLQIGDAVDESHHQPITSPYRYDHLRVRLIPDIRIDPKIRNLCFAQGYEDGVYYFPIRDMTGHDIPNCQFDPLSLRFGCDSEFVFDQFGTARFETIKVRRNNAEVPGATNTGGSNSLSAQEGDTLEIEPTIFNQKTDKCLYVSYPQTNIPPVTYPVIAGTFPLTVTVDPQFMRIGEQQLSQLSAPSDITMELIRNENVNPVTFSVGIDIGDDYKYDVSGSSTDKIIINTNKEITINELVTVTKKQITLENSIIVSHEQSTNAIVVSVSNAAVAIRGISQSTITGQQKKQVGGAVTIQPKQVKDTATKQIRLQVFNLVPNAQSASDCDVNNPALTEASFNGREVVSDVYVLLGPKSVGSQGTSSGVQSAASGGGLPEIKIENLGVSQETAGGQLKVSADIKYTTEQGETINAEVGLGQPPGTTKKQTFEKINLKFEGVLSADMTGGLFAGPATLDFTVRTSKQKTATAILYLAVDANRKITVDTQRNQQTVQIPKSTGVRITEFDISPKISGTVLAKNSKYNPTINAMVTDSTKTTATAYGTASIIIRSPSKKIETIPAAIDPNGKINQKIDITLNEVGTYTIEFVVKSSDGQSEDKKSITVTVEENAKLFADTASKLLTKYQKAPSKDTNDLNEAALWYADAIRLDSTYFPKVVTAGNSLPPDDLSLLASFKILGYVPRDGNYAPPDNIQEMIKRFEQNHGLTIDQKNIQAGHEVTNELNSILNAMKTNNMLLRLDVAKPNYAISHRYPTTPRTAEAEILDAGKLVSKSNINEILSSYDVYIRTGNSKTSETTKRVILKNNVLEYTDGSKITFTSSVPFQIFVIPKNK